jgi:hypothetical protein
MPVLEIMGNARQQTLRYSRDQKTEPSRKERCDSLSPSINIPPIWQDGYGGEIGTKDDVWANWTLSMWKAPAGQWVALSSLSRRRKHPYRKGRNDSGPELRKYGRYDPRGGRSFLLE